MTSYGVSRTSFLNICYKTHCCSIFLSFFTKHVKLKVKCCIFLQILPNVQRTSSKRHEKKSVGWRRYDDPRMLILPIIQIQFRYIILNLTFANVGLKYSFCILLRFSGKFKKMSYKSPKVTSAMWCSWDVSRMSILNIFYRKHFCYMIFIFSLQNVCIKH